MNPAITVELEFFLTSILWGIILLIAYDILRIFRRIIKHDEFFIAIEDLIFWVAASLFIFIMIYHMNNGIIRGFSIMGMLLGGILYHFAFSDLLVETVAKLINILISPITMVLRQVKRFLCFLLSKVRKFINNLLNRLKKVVKSVKIALKKRKNKPKKPEELGKQTRSKKRKGSDIPEKAEKAKKSEKSEKSEKKKGSKKSEETEKHKGSEKPEGSKKHKRSRKSERAEEPVRSNMQEVPKQKDKKDNTGKK